LVWTSEAEEPVLDLPGVHVADPTPKDFARGLLWRARDDTSRPPLEKLEQYSWRQYFEGVEQVLVQSNPWWVRHACAGDYFQICFHTGKPGVICVVFLKHLLFELAWVILFPVQYVPGTAGDRLRRLIWRFFLGGMGKRVHIDIGVQFVNPRFIFVGDDTWIDKYAILIAGPPYEGKRILCRKPNQEFPAKEGELHIGSMCHIAPHSLIQAHGGVWIGNELDYSVGLPYFIRCRITIVLWINRREGSIAFRLIAKEEDQALIVSPVVIKNGAAVGLNAVVMARSRYRREQLGGHKFARAGNHPAEFKSPQACLPKVEREIVLEPSRNEKPPVNTAKKKPDKSDRKRALQ